MKIEMTNNNYQISNKHNKQLTKIQKKLHTFGFSKLEYWNLFVFWDLRIGAYLKFVF